MRSDVEVRAERMVAGGLALCRDADGRIVLVDGALPGERVTVTTHQRHGATHGEVVTVLEAADGRVTPPCPYVDAGCGGCNWQHAHVDLQHEMRLEIVADALRRLGHIPQPVVRAGPPVEAERTRNTLRLAVIDGRLGMRHERSHDIVVLDDCLVARPALAELLAPGALDPGAATELTIRVGTEADGSDGDCLVVAHPSASSVSVPDGVSLVGTDDLAKGTRRWIHTHIAGVRFRVSARSFLQVRTGGAEALVAIARAHLAGAPNGPLADLYGGIGLFAATLAGDRPVVLVERSKAATADARVNLVELPGGARIISQPVERWRPSPAAVVVADPARTGLGSTGVKKVAETGAGRLVLISCDAGSLGRDAAQLHRAGYHHTESVVVDLFGHTGHVEVVSRFDLV